MWLFTDLISIFCCRSDGVNFSLGITTQSPSHPPGSESQTVLISAAAAAAAAAGSLLIVAAVGIYCICRRHRKNYQEGKWYK